MHLCSYRVCALYIYIYIYVLCAVVIITLGDQRLQSIDLPLIGILKKKSVYTSHKPV